MEMNMTPNIFLAGAALISVSISPLNAEASEAPWCAVISRGGGNVKWDCTYRSIEECRPNVIAGNLGFCNPSPYYVANSTGLRISRQTSQMGLKTAAKSEKAVAVKKECPQDRRKANTRTKIVASPITVKTPQQPDDKSGARAVREDAHGNSIDTICGRVRGKLAGDTGDRPFVYVVQKDEAYIGAYVLATTEYRKICN
jgi:hypothetical protein